MVQNTGNRILVQIVRMGARAGQPGLPTAPAGHLVRMPHYIRLLEVQIQMQIQIQIQIQKSSNTIKTNPASQLVRMHHYILVLEVQIQIQIQVQL